MGCRFLQLLLGIEEFWSLHSKRGFSEVFKITFDETSLEIVAKGFAIRVGVLEAFLLRK